MREVRRMLFFLLVLKSYFMASWREKERTK